MRPPRSWRCISRASATPSVSAGSPGGLARRKPVLALKGGATAAGARAAASHTAALASSDAAVDALFHQAGVQRTKTLSEFLDAAALLSSQPLPLGPNVAVVTNAGGLGILFADGCAGQGLILPEPSSATAEALRAVMPAEGSRANPIDLLGSATAETFEAALPFILADDAFDAVCVLFVRPVLATAADVGRALDRAAGLAGRRKPVVAVLLADAAADAFEPLANVATFASPESAAAALGVAVKRSAWLRRREGVVPALNGVDRAAARDVVAAALRTTDEAWLDVGRAGGCSMRTASRRPRGRGRDARRSGGRGPVVRSGGRGQVGGRRRTQDRNGWRGTRSP